MTRPTLAFDFDDVLIEFNDHFRQYHNTHYGTDLQYEDLTSYVMHEIWPCSEAVITRRVKDFYRSIEHECIPSTNGARDALEHLSKRADLQIVTSRPKLAHDPPRRLITRRFPNIFTELHLTNGFAASDTTPSRAKSEVCMDIGASIMVEDALKHAEDVAQYGIPVLLPDRPWNQDYTPDGVTRVYNWDEIVAGIEAHC